MAQIRCVYRPSSRSETYREKICWWSYCWVYFFTLQRPFNQSDLIFLLFILFLMFTGSLWWLNLSLTATHSCACILSIMMSSCPFLIFFFLLPSPQCSHVQTALCVCVCVHVCLALEWHINSWHGYGALPQAMCLWLLFLFIITPPTTTTPC